MCASDQVRILQGPTEVHILHVQMSSTHKGRLMMNTLI